MKLKNKGWGRVIDDLEYEREAWGNELKKSLKAHRYQDVYEAHIKLEYVEFILDEVITGNIHVVPSKGRKK